MERPDLSRIEPAVRAYIEWLEGERARLSAERAEEPETDLPADELPLEPSEPPTTRNVITLTRSGQAKRTARHLYQRQRRGGMGVLDLDAAAADPPAAVLVADERAQLLVISSRARAFRLPVYFLNESAAVRARPQPFMVSAPLEAGETWAVLLVAQAQPQGHLAVVSRRGFVRAVPAHLFSESMREGLSVLRLDDDDAPAAACWAAGDSDLLIATRRGLAARFPLKQVPMPGAVGLRVEASDEAVAITAVRPESGVLFLGADGKGTIRLMSGFAANKAPGVGGKLALKTDALIGAAAVDAADDVFILSRLGKMIRFRAGEIPAKEGVVQGVICMSLRGDACLSLAISRAESG